MGGGSQTSTQVTELPEWLDQAAEFNIEQAQQLAERPYEPYDYARIAPFSMDQTASMDYLRAMGPEALTPTGYDDYTMALASSPIMQYQNQSILDPIMGAGGSDNLAGGEGGYGIADYMNPYVGAVLGDTLSEMNRQADISRLGVNRASTMAGAFGDASHGVQMAELDRNLLDLAGQQANRTYADAFTQAMGLRESDLARQLQGFQTNLGAYEGGLQRGIGGAQQAAAIDTQEQQDMMNYLNALYQSGGAQQTQAQASADLGYQDFLNQFGYPSDLLSMLSATTSIQPHGQTTTTTSQNNAGFGSILGGILGIGSMFI